MRRDWHPVPANPVNRFLGYDFFAHWKPTITERIVRWIIPSLNQVSIPDSYWRGSSALLFKSHDDATFRVSAERCGVKTDEELEVRLNQIRREAWQITQEFSIARWWFLRSVLEKNPFYGEIREQARSGATIVDLGCGFGQELRFLRDDGATGKLYGVDKSKGMWKLGLRLFDDPDTDLEFRELDIIEDGWTKARNPLFEFEEKADIYLLNDFLSFFGPIAIENTLKSIGRASRVGTKIIGWAIGQDGDEVKGMGVWGTGVKGTINNSKTFGINWGMAEAVTKTKWKVEVKMVDFEELGFDEVDCQWFAGDFFEDDSRGKLEKLRGLCFLATRTL